MNNTFKLIILLLTSVLLTSCGGGGGGATGPTQPVIQGLKFTFIPVDSSLPSNTLGYPHFLGSPFMSQVDVRVTFDNNQIVPDGTIVNFSTSNAEVAYVARPDDPATTTVNEFTGVFATIANETSGGRAIFYVHGVSPGSVNFTASATSPQDSRSYSASLAYSITQGPSPIDQLVLSPQRTNVPANVQGVDYFQGTPFVTEVDVTFRDVFGNVTNPSETATVSVSPSSVLLFSRLDDLETDDVNEFLTPVSQGSIPMVAGHGTIYLWSQGIPGTANVTVSLVEAVSGFEFNDSFTVQVVDDGSTPGLPSQVNVSEVGALYSNGSGGTTTQSMTITVNGGNVPVTDPAVNNVQLSMVTDAPNSGERLVGTSVNGGTVQGNDIRISTLNGVAIASVQSGTEPNTITVTATVDKADNNVDNGIQDPLSAVTNVIVSDGVLWALDLTSPALDAIDVNGDITVNGNLISYNFQDGTYSLVMSAIGTDKGGNPALPQTVQFGLVDSPITGYPFQGSGVFEISGADGDPQEGGSTFTSLLSNFFVDGGGVQPGDTLLVFGEESLGNEDLESSNTISSINSQVQVSILERFNRNDSTGSINNDFGILPFIIGRAVDGNIEATAVLNENGVATTFINYPVSKLGKISAIYVKGQGPIENSVVKSVADVEVIAYPGIEGFSGQSSQLIISPNAIPGNNSVAFTACLYDSANNPIPGRFVAFSYLGNGTGSIDGQSGAGVMNTATGPNGCTTGLASTSGVIPGGQPTSGFNFTSGGVACTIPENSVSDEYCLSVLAPDSGVLNANPSSFRGRGTVQITLSLYDGSGTPIEGAAIQGQCDQVSGGVLSLFSGPSITDANGQSFVSVTVSLDAPGGGLDGTCTFSTASGDPSVDVHFTGLDSCTVNNPSPVPPIGACDEPDQYTVSGIVEGMTTGPIVLQNNGADDISLDANGSFQFPPQDDGSTYIITVLTDPPGQTCNVANGIGNIAAANVNNVVVTCTP